MFRRLAASFAIALFLVNSVFAQSDAVLTDYYGSGVHAYFLGDNAEAHDYLTKSIDGGTQDPRAYYFRALVYERTGRADESQADMQRGSELEVADINRFYPVDRSLARVQGRVRVGLEKHRVAARLADYEMRNRRRKERFGDQTPAGLINEKPDPRVRPEPAAPSDAADDLFSEEPAAAGGGDLFDAPADARPVEDAPAAVDPEPVDAPAGGDDPFGADEPAKADDADDPFGADAPAEPAEPAEPAASDDGDDGDDPFAGGGDDAPADKADGDPFGDDPVEDAPTEEEDDDDPFAS